MGTGGRAKPRTGKKWQNRITPEEERAIRGIFTLSQTVSLSTRSGGKIRPIREYKPSEEIKKPLSAVATPVLEFLEGKIRPRIGLGGNPVLHDAYKKITDEIRRR